MAEQGPRGVLANEQIQNYFAMRRPWDIGVAPDDVDILPSPSTYDAADVDLTARASRRYNLPLPLIVSPMTDLVGKKMAITASMNGFLAVVPPTFPIEEQRHIVRATKLYLNGLVDKQPITTTPDQTIGQVMQMLKKGDFHFTTIPVVDQSGSFLGMLDQDHFDFLKKARDTLVASVMKPAGSLAIGSQGMEPQAAYDIMSKKMQRALPITDPKTDKLTGLFVWSDVSRIVDGNGGMLSLDDKGRLLTAMAVSTQLDPTGDHFDALDRVKASGKDLNILVVDTSTGSGKYATPCTKELRELIDKEFPHIDLISGNAVDVDSAALYADLPADGERIGVGIGSICQTSTALAIGSDSLTAVHESAVVVKQIDPNITIIADGGLRDGAKLAKALAAGADIGMAGRMVAGAEENPVEPYYNKKGEFVQQYRGQGSTSMQKQAKKTQADRYEGATDEDGEQIIFSQGYEGEVPYVGSVMKVVTEQMLAVRLTVSDTGASNIQEFQERARFRQASRNSQKGAHDIRVIGT